MKKGILYFNFHMESKNGSVAVSYTRILLCTENSDGQHFSGVIVFNDDHTSDQQQGTYSKTWNSTAFEEYKGDKACIIWSKEYKEIGVSQGGN